MSPRTNRAGTAEAGADAPRTSVLPPPTTVASAGPAGVAGAHPLLLRCPECGATEGAGAIGNVSHEQVRLNSRHYADERGYPYCRECFAVWNGLPIEVALQTDRVEVAPPVEPYARIGGRPSQTSTRGPRLPVNLYQLQRNVDSSFTLATTGHEALRRAGDRLRDAEVVAEYVGLPRGTREAVLYHLAFLTQRASLRSLAWSVSGEAFVLATVSLVAARFRVPVEQRRLLESIRFTDGSTVAPAEFEKATNALRAWYAQNLWRDSPSSNETKEE